MAMFLKKIPKISLEALLWTIVYIAANLWAIWVQVAITFSVSIVAKLDDKIEYFVVSQFFIFVIILITEFFRKKQGILLVIKFLGDLLIFILQITIVLVFKLDVIGGFLLISWAILFSYYMLFMLPKK